MLTGELLSDERFATIALRHEKFTNQIIAEHNHLVILASPISDDDKRYIINNSCWDIIDPQYKKQMEAIWLKED